ncbi:MAG TPA: alpha-glucan family phosphorylase [Anaerohalosphaeraceae bacterium]|nr:alpha-glucan family phosphorylase [Phycisphaerae bacterium]HOK95098.1 alpha-glucan family phosphorylase [Anaerohalosphaeraceae bacterium]HOL31225.1 alpha-glucan family phosphorylase [Anaerohalosphaeraceae bacterium]HPC63836.1 alpha-glucan family phosphorylase [Anaerohalosphaeraceae bacterium]HPO69489.1 alpha-glucan family phosphorylase [Anaerohalosphaeraceae bacterium]
MQTVHTFTVKPSLPEQLKDLQVIVRNLYWTWHYDITEIFRRIDYDLWKQCIHNPVKMLGMVSQARLEDLARNEGFLYQLKQARETLEKTLNAPSWFNKIYAREGHKTLIAYFCAEFGIHESMPIYSGGLGMLSGDHLKSASDLGIPLVGVGLMYQKGYFRQYLNTDGWQQEHYIDNDFHNMPLELVQKENGHPVLIGIQFPDRTVQAQIWKAMIGRTPLYLLDTNLTVNSFHDRTITQTLYGGDSEMRICQEIVLGIGGLKALFALGLEPTVCHMNEGHAAFMALERVRKLRSRYNMTFEEALEAARASNVFTVHTPVAAGNDEFPVEMIDKYFSHYYGTLGINREQFLALGRVHPNDSHESFKMPVLALRTSTYRNGVSQLHGEVSRKIWSGLWPELPVSEIPITSITNGIHAKTWLSPELNSLYERYLGSRWADEAVDKSIWHNLDQVPDEELWRIHQRGKERLVAFARTRLKRQLQRRGAFHTELSWAEEVLDPEALTIGFARRFATYKRGNLLLREPQRLIKLLSNTETPVQFIFAGKAHPRDTAGKEIIRQLVHFASENPEIRRRLIFLEDYDMDIARYLVQGVDVWLNNPRRPMEASGTSGMKAAINGVLNMSTLDGWWCEGYIPDGGWIIGAGEEYDDLSYQDQVESQAIYNLLEQEVVPLFFNRGKDRLPRRWIRRMKNTIKWCAPRFNTSRMVAEYTRRFYHPADLRWQELTANEMERVKALSLWKQKIRQSWSDLQIRSVETKTVDGEPVGDYGGKQPELSVGSQVQVQSRVHLGRLEPTDISVQIYYGRVDSSGQIKDGQISEMAYVDNSLGPERVGQFSGTIPCRISGQHGFALRILPRHPDLVEPYESGLVLWETGR